MTIEFSDWWCKNGNINKAEQLYGKRVSAICDRIDPDIKILNLYTDILEKFAFKYRLHLV
jgi:hypothetical protein